MAFKPRSALNGELDPNINTLGRIKTDTPKLTNRQLREREMLTLLRKLKPLVAESINTAANIMGNKEASHQNQLKAAVIILENYKSMVGDLYSETYDDEGAEEIQQQNVPLFSLKVVE